MAFTTIVKELSYIAQLKSESRYDDDDSQIDVEGVDNEQIQQDVYNSLCEEVVKLKRRNEKVVQ